MWIFYKEQALVLGNFNAKIGKIIERNKETAIDGGRILIKMIEKENTGITNSNTQVCRELWTRKIDYGCNYKQITCE